MKTTIILLVIYFLAVNVSYSHDFEWGKSYGGTSYDSGEAIDIDALGNIYVTGYYKGTADFDPGSAINEHTAVGYDDFFVQKFDSSGNLLWVKSFGSTDYDRGLAISVDASGNVYTTGFFSGTVDFDPGVGVSNLSSAGLYDVFVQKLDASGDFLWAKSFGESGTDRAHSIVVDAIGNVYTTGEFIGTVDFDPGAGVSNLTSVGGPDVFVQKLDASGNFLWAKSVGGAYSDISASISVNDLGEAYITGTFEGTVDFDPGASVTSITSAGNEDIFVQKLDASGSFLWAKAFGSTGFDRGQSIDVSTSGEVYVSGRFEGTVDFGSGSGLMSNGNTDVFVQKLDASGNFLWAKSFGANADDEGHDLKVDVLGNVYTIGVFYGTVDFDPGTGVNNLISAGGPDVFIQKLNASGNFLWAKSFRGTLFTWRPSINLDASRSVYSLGTFQGTVDFDPDAGISNHTSAGSADVFLQKMSQCDPDSVLDIQMACDTFTWIDGNNYTVSNNTATHTLLNQMGCDSVIWLDLTIHGTSASTTIDTACNSYTWNGTTYTTSGTYTWSGTNAVGCDSTATLELTLLNQITSTTVDTACGSYAWNGTTYTTSGTYTWQGTSSFGCDSIATLNLTINNATTSIVTETACDSLVWNGATYTVSGTYIWQGTNSAGCDSTATLNLTINNSTTSSATEIACDSYMWNGTTYTTSGTYTWQGTNSVGCDSIATLNLTINNSTTSSTTEIACDSFVWNGTTYTSSGTYTWQGTNSIGCDSTATLNLTIGNQVNNTVNETACVEYIWHGTTYTSSGTYTWVGTSLAGCDSVVTLNLTIHTPTTSSIMETACDSYDWNGTTYTTSGIYTWMGTNAVGCDSTATLNLTINNTSVSTVSENACSDYTWNGATYTASGTYTWTGTNSVGCDSTVTLNLTITPVASTTTDTTCSDYTWNGVTYTTSGTYTWEGISSGGCDSIATLNLTVSSPEVTLYIGRDTVCLHGELLYMAGVPAGGVFSGPGVVNNVFTPSNAGIGVQTITYDYTDANGCSASTSEEIYVQGCAALIGLEDVEINVFPNPTFGMLNVEVSGAQLQEVTLYDMHGRMVENLLCAEDYFKFAMPNLVRGVYSLEVKTSLGIVRKRVVYQ